MSKLERMMLKTAGTLLGLLLIASLFMIPASTAHAEDSIDIAYSYETAPFQFTDEAGKPAGMLIDFWNLWSKETGVNINFIPATWFGSLEMVKEGKADAHAGLFYSKQRDEFLDYGPALTKTDTHIFYHESLPDLSGGKELLPYRIGVIKDDLAEDHLRKTVPGISLVTYTSYDAMMADMKSGLLKVFAADTPTGLFYLRKYDLSKVFQFKASKPLYQNDWFVAVPQGKKQALDLISKGLENISSQEKLTIVRQWDGTSGKRDADTLVLAIDRNYSPFYFVGNDGKPKGLFVDIWKLWAEKTGTSIDFRPSDWPGTLEAVKSGEADIHTGLFENTERAKWMDFSIASYEIPNGLYFKSDTKLTPLDKMKGKRVGAITGSYHESWLRKNYPDVKVVQVIDSDGLVVGLLKGTVDAIVSDSISTDSHIKSLGLQKSIVRYPKNLFTRTLHGAILKDNPILMEKINDGLMSLSRKELADIEAQWIENPKNRHFLSGTGEVSLTRAEEAWLKAHPSIRFSNELDWPPYDFMEDGKPQGFSVDFINLISKKIGMNVEWVNGYTWKTLSDMAKKRQIDVLQSVAKSEAREQYLNYTSPYHVSATTIFTRPADSSIDGLAQLSGKRVAVVKGFSLQALIGTQFPKIKLVEVDSPNEGLTYVSLGKADAYIDRQTVCQYFIKKNSIPNVVFASLTGLPDLDVKSMYMGVRKDWPELTSILDKGIAEVSEKEMNDLKEKWFGIKSGTDIGLTEEEETWITNNPILRIAATPNWPPFEFDDNGRYRGVAADILNLVAVRTGLRLDVQFSDWSNVLGRLKNGEAEVGPAMVETDIRKRYLSFTDPVFVSQVAIFVEKETDTVSTLADLKGMTVAIEEGYATHELLADNYPDIKLTLVKAPIDAIRLVSSKKADAYLGNQAATSYLMSKNVITNLKSVGYFDEASRDLRMGVRKDLPILLDILNKGLSSITVKEKNDLLARYIQSGTSQTNTETLELTVEEKNWIQQHKNIRLGVDAAWPPIEFFESTTFKGLSSEYVKQLSKDTGLSFAQPSILNWEEVIKRAKEKELDVLPGIVKTPERAKHLSFSRPYTKYPMVIYQRTNSVPVENMTDLDGVSVAVVKDYASEEFMRANHPDVRVQTYLTLEEATMALSKGMVDALVDIAVAVEHIKQKRSLFNIAPSTRTPYVVELKFGVRKDWPQLIQIIDKWLATLSEDTHKQLERAAGIDYDAQMVAEEEIETMDYTQLIYFGGGIITVFGIGLICLLFLRRFITSRAETLYSSHQYKIVGIIIGILFLCLVAVATWYALAQVETRVRNNVADSLESVLLTTHESLAIWQEQNKNGMTELTEDPVLRAMTRALLTLPEDVDVIRDSPQLWNIRKYMNKRQRTRGFVDFSIISKNFLNYAASDDPDLLDKNAISIQRPRVLDKAFLGSTVFVPPVTIDTDHAGSHGIGSLSIISMAAPIKGKDGKVMAVLVLNYDTNSDYQRIIALGRIGMTGETYAFDGNGSLVSESRFNELLQDLGLIEKNQRGMLHLRISDPGGNLVEGHELDRDRTLPLTQSVRSATERKSGSNVEGYRDYRGVPVYGAWLWDEKLGLGLVTEIDEAEALGAYRMVRKTVASVILITILLGFIMTGLSNWIGQSAAKSLSKAKDELEDRVEERTAELKKVSVAVEQSPATVVITDTNGTIEYVNPTFTEMTGYTWDEAIGQNPRVLKSGYHPEQFYQELWTTILQGNVWNGDFLNKRKNGQTFWERAAIAPILGDKGEITHFVAVKEDITERKAQEERFQSLLDAAPDAVVLVADTGEITLVNIATEELFGYTREEMIGQKVEMLLPDSIRADHPSHREKFFATPGDMSLVAGKEFRGQTKDGNIVPVDISLSPIESDEGIQIIASIRDITERKKAEKAIAESEERTRLILSSAGEGIFGVNLRGEAIFINEAACEMLQYTSDEILGKSVHDIIHHTRADGSFYPVEECPMRHAFVEGLTSRIDDEVLWRKDGTSFEVEYAAVPVMRGAEMIGAVISFQDITERKAAERERDDAYNVITSSIQYASRIQRSVLPPELRIIDLTADHFVLWEPRDVVGGDMYWCELWGEGSVIILGDCTGHGVPGAFMTLLSTGALKRALSQVPEGDSAGIVSTMHKSIQKQLGQNVDNASATASDDGLELGVCYLAPDNNSITYAGARMPLFIDNGDSIDIIKGDKKGIAYRGIPADFEYTNKKIELQDDQTFIMTTDGIIDQVGGEKGRGFGKKRFIALLESLRETPLQKQGEAIYSQLEEYQGKEKRRDDVSIIGFRL